MQDWAPGPLTVGERNPDPLYPDEVAIMAHVKAGDRVGPDQLLVKCDGAICVAIAVPTRVRPDAYPAFTDANAARLVAAWNAAEGIPTARLAPGAVAKLVAAARECERMLLDLGDPFRGDHYDAMQTIRAALAPFTEAPHAE